jgi:hypothetical protein
LGEIGIKIGEYKSFIVSAGLELGLSGIGHVNQTAAQVERQAVKVVSDLNDLAFRRLLLGHHLGKKAGAVRAVARTQGAGQDQQTDGEGSGRQGEPGLFAQPGSTRQGERASQTDQ